MSGSETLVLETKNADVTRALGRLLGTVLKAGDVVALTGELGAGKTCLTQGIAEGLGISGEYRITSPTFTLVNEYPGRLTLYHVDVYRLAGQTDLYDLGFDEFSEGQGVVVIEWAEKIREAVPEGALWIFLSYVDDATRRIEIAAPEEIPCKNDLVELCNRTP
ncbi:MAG: tRNA (adenosine(37)-N6)-threonylcarbamoyltransferase complex ATPase subunit type 1 TsaE [Deltaproteobacteria bacterium HGW-Deltaproteobacteria-19]|jgi:tRNA threonylcarbamoyladenosine biosynthesis protein TsaE|nr:MAG: tRNA (adenosine(37)-N6)-threonylcarbamoyltransferase complex ATPase subunit type 1 TsaE [Deltaproteobacteria bacterium HGW-Deltaproteobacteria-19]